MNSILQTERRCWFCGRADGLECHHIYPGANRNLSEQYGFKAWLCHDHHNEPPDGVHFSHENMRKLQRACQAEFEKTHTRADFVSIIGRNFLED